ncbi:MAG: hypothetical protein RMY63_36905, partial [Nostoc sp. ChiQUE01b]|nr:hypothetical protein [Nostoc sp. ChiQUE01b]
MRIIFETDGDKEVRNSTVTSLDETVDTSSSANWRYAIATSVVIRGFLTKSEKMGSKTATM